MSIWQADFYKSSTSPTWWELVLCDEQGEILQVATCPQGEASVPWLIQALTPLVEAKKPEKIQVFRPQSWHLFQSAALSLGVGVEATRKTPQLKGILARRTGSPVVLEQPPPQPLPDQLWGDSWRFATLPAGDLWEGFRDRPLPILHLPETLHPQGLGLASSTPIPGIIIYGGRQSMRLARWLEEVQPVAVNYIPTVVGQSGGLVLEAGLVDRWILVTFEDAEVAQSAQLYQSRQSASQGLHFVFIQPDDSGMTATAFWLLQVDRSELMIDPT